MAVIQLTRGFVTIVDDDRFEELNRYSWYASGPEGRPARRLRDGTRRLIYLYHQVLSVNPWELQGLQVDHINNNPLDNRLCNLRIVTYSENQLNSDRVRKALGVSFDRTHNKYKAYVGAGAARINIGTFRTREEAIAARAKFIEQRSGTVKRED